MAALGWIRLGVRCLLGRVEGDPQIRWSNPAPRPPSFNPMITSFDSTRLTRQHSNQFRLGKPANQYPHLFNLYLFPHCNLTPESQIAPRGRCDKVAVPLINLSSECLEPHLPKQRLDFLPEPTAAPLWSLHFHQVLDSKSHVVPKAYLGRLTSASLVRRSTTKP